MMERIVERVVVVGIDVEMVGVGSWKISKGVVRKMEV